MKRNEESPWDNLANAIIIQAATDWRKANKKLQRNPGNDIARKDMAEIEKFFMSDWYAELTSVPGDKLLSMLRKEAENGR